MAVNLRIILMIGSNVLKKMTVTALGSFYGLVILEDVKKKANTLKNVLSVDVELVFELPWFADMVSKSGKFSLGLL